LFKASTRDPRLPEGLSIFNRLISSRRLRCCFGEWVVRQIRQIWQIWAGVVRDGSVRETFGFRWVMMAPRDAGSGARVCLFYSAAEVELG